MNITPVLGDRTLYVECVFGARRQRSKEGREEEGGTEHHREERERLAVGGRLEEGRAGVRSTHPYSTYVLPMPLPHRLSPWECEILPHLMQGVHDLQGEA